MREYIVYGNKKCWDHPLVRETMTSENYTTTFKDTADTDNLQNLENLKVFFDIEDYPEDELHVFLVTKSGGLAYQWGVGFPEEEE